MNLILEEYIYNVCRAGLSDAVASAARVICHSKLREISARAV